MQIQLREEIDALRQMPVGELRAKYLEVFGEESRSNHKQFLFRRIAWRLQALAEGGLSERARRRALEIANDADLRIRAPKAFDASAPGNRSVRRRISVTDPRLPGLGQFLVREYKGRSIEVKVRTDGFEYDGRIHRSLSAIAREVTGTKWNGFLFFNLAPLNGEANAQR
jgi:hypothetical protein